MDSRKTVILPLIMKQQLERAEASLYSEKYLRNILDETVKTVPNLYGIWGESLQTCLVALADYSSTSISRTFTDDCKEII